MIHLRTVKEFCKEYTRIENYEEAINDTTQTWVCHHILGEILSREQLLDHDFYYDVPPCMLKFVTRAEHNQIYKPNKGIPHTDESRKKMSESHKGKPAWNKGKHGIYSEDTRRKISEAMKGHTPFNGHHHSEDTRIKMSESHKGRIPWNKGKKGLTYKKIRKRTDINNNVTVTSTTSLN